MKHDKRYSLRRSYRGKSYATVLNTPQLFRVVFPELTKADHKRLAESFKRCAADTLVKQSKAIAAAEKKYGHDGSIISGGFRSSWPEAVKDKIRKLAHERTFCVDASIAHADAAKIR